MDSRRVSRRLIAIGTVAFLLRVAVRAYSGPSDFWSNGYTLYFDLARGLANGHGYGDPPTIFRVPIYSMLLAAVTLGRKAFIPIVVCQSLIGAGTVVCGALVTAELFGPIAALAAAAIAAVYPYYVVHDTAMQETSLFTFLTLLSVLLLVRARRSKSMKLLAICGKA